jgi:hypothetical protein
MSIVFDCFWWWRGEFGGGIANPYIDAGAPESQDDIPATNTAENSQRKGSAEQAIDSLLDPAAFGDLAFTDVWSTGWDWAAGQHFDEFLDPSSDLV